MDWAGPEMRRVTALCYLPNRVDSSFADDEFLVRSAAGSQIPTYVVISVETSMSEGAKNTLVCPPLEH